MLKKGSKGGFTLVELVVVIAILAILAAIAVPVVTQTLNGAVLSAASNDARNLESCLKLAKADVSVGNTDTYGDRAKTRQLKVGEVLREQGVENACETRVYQGKEIAPAWVHGEVRLLYTDNHTDVETGYVVADPVYIRKDSNILVVNLSNN